MLTCLTLAALLAPGGFDRPKDRIELRNGKVIQGHVLYRDERRTLALVGSREREFEHTELASVDSVVDSMDVLLDRLDRVDETDAEGLLDLARYARDNRLPRESELLAWCAIAADPELDAAHDLLEHRTRNGKRLVRVGKREYSLEDLRGEREWSDAWEFQTTHFELSTNLPLEEALGVALDLERVYRDLMEFLGPELLLRDVLVPMPAQVHADEASFPEALGGRRSYFSPELRTLFVNAGKGYDRWTLVHEATHQVMHCSAEGHLAGRGVDLPGWLEEGLAEYMAGNALGERGRVHAKPGGVCVPHFRTHAESRDPYDLSRLLTFGIDDFSSSSNERLKYAQSYTFVHFMLHAEGQRHRPALMDFLRSCWGGKGSSGTFMKAVDVRERDLQEAWDAYVRENV